MMSVNEVSKLTGISIRTLRYYDAIGLLKPDRYTESGYRLYDDAALSRLRQILLFRELEFPLKEIAKILDAPDFDRDKALETQIGLLELKAKRLRAIIELAREIKENGEKNMDFTAFDKEKIREYSKRAKEQWGDTEAYREYERRAEGLSEEDEVKKADEFMTLFKEFGEMKDMDPASEKAKTQVKKLQDHITAHYYTCTDTILQGLGAMYASGGEFTENIDKAGGKGTAEFAAEAIAYYCGKK